jgi:poly(A) polymerase
LLAVLDRDGEEARVVGGAVRNALLGEPVTEWDIATTALPAEVTARGRRAGWKVAPTGIEHGTVTVIIDAIPFEVTTLREDVATDGRHAVVRFGRDFRADAMRRDFTINALSIARTGEMFDYAGGLDDLAARHIRFIGDADRRIAEDYLRILRLFRFHARYGQGPIDGPSFAAAIRQRAGLARLSRERVRAEILKLLSAPGAASVLTQIDGAGFLLAVLGGICRTATFARLVAAETMIGLPTDALRRLAALAIFVSEDAGRVSSLLRLSNAESRRLEMIAAAGETIIGEPDAQVVGAMAYRLGVEGARDALLVAGARRAAPPWTDALGIARTWPARRSPFGGADAARLGLEPGPDVGRLLAEAERLWIAAGFPADATRREAILAQAATRVQATRAQAHSGQANSVQANSGEATRPRR